MLETWLGDLTLERFRSSYLGQQAIAKPGTGIADCARLDWYALGRVLQGAAEPDVLVVAKGDLVRRPTPRSLEELLVLFESGIGLCIRHTELVDPGLAEVARAFDVDIGPAHVQVFTTPANTYGFSWHFDEEDVFIVQTIGVKEYYFRANTVTRATAGAAAFQSYPQEASPMFAATLRPGDFLYIPARWWHMADSHQDSLAISVGVMRR